MISYLRFLWRNKLYTAIELVGLAVALAFVLFIATFVVNEVGYDRQLENTEDIYIGTTDTYLMMSYTIKDMVLNSFPEVEDACAFISTDAFGGVKLAATVGEESFKQNAFAVDKSFFDLFTFPFVEGDRDKALQESNSVVVSQSFANRYFPNKSALGQSLTLNIEDYNIVLQISGVFEDIERSVFPNVDMIYDVNNLEKAFPALLRNGSGEAGIFYKLQDGTDVEELEKKIFEKVKEEDVLYSSGLYKEFRLAPFSQIHYGVCEVQFPFVDKLDLDFILLFIAAGILLLVFAIFNYISLTVAQIGFRAKEMATRQLLGEQRLEIVWRYIREALMLTFVAFCISMLIVWSLQPYFNELIGKEINVLDSLSVFLVLIIVLVLFAVAVLAGLIPALLVSKYKPINVVKGEFAASTKMTLGKWFMFIQNAVAIITLCVSFAMFLQFKHLLARDGGFDRENIITITGGVDAASYFEEELKAFPFVESVGHMSFTPIGNGRSSMSMVYNGEKISLSTLSGDTTAFNVLGFRVMSASGADVSNVDLSIWLTESAMRAMGLDYDVDNVVLSGENVPICGIIKDIQIGNRTIEECAKWNIIYINTRQDKHDFNNFRTLVVKIIGDENEALKQIKEFYDKKDATHRLRMDTHKQIYREYFTSEENNLELITIFTLLTIMLSAMAMLAMSTYFAKQNAKNYSIKKVFGYERREIFWNMVGGFLKVVALAAVVAIPVGYYIVGEWLSSYSYRIGNHWWIYLASVAFIAVVAVGVICWQAVRLMNADPVKELKKE